MTVYGILDQATPIRLIFEINLAPSEVDFQSPLPLHNSILRGGNTPEMLLFVHKGTTSERKSS